MVRETFRSRQIMLIVIKKMCMKLKYYKKKILSIKMFGSHRNFTSDRAQIFWSTFFWVCPTFVKTKKNLLRNEGIKFAKQN